jgi:glutathione S-transferase
MAQYTLVIGNKNYSSWSMRPWVLLRQAAIAFDEVLLKFHSAEWDKHIARYSPAGLVPVLWVDQQPVWDTLAICEAVAELHPEKKLWPADRRARQIARSICAEMHAGFRAMRGAMPMNIRGSYPGRGMTPEAARDIGRIAAIWEQCRTDHGAGGELLFGQFTAADAFYAPVVSRFRTYAVELPPVAQAYADAVLRLPAMRDWAAAALQETEFVAEDEPYAQVKGEG